MTVGDPVVRLLERAASDGHTVLPVSTVLAALPSLGVQDPAGAVANARSTGQVVACAGDLIGLPRWTRAEEAVASDLARLLSARPDGVTIVTCAGGRLDGTRGAASTAGLGRVVENAESLHLEAAADLLGAVPDGGRVTLMGDPGLLPPPGPGRVYADLLAAGVAPVLDAVAAPRGPHSEPAGPLARLSSAVRAGLLPALDPADREVVLVPAADDTTAAHRVRQLVGESIPRALGVPTRDVAVVAVLRHGPAGVDALAAALAAHSVGVGWVGTVHEARALSWPAVVAVLPARASGVLSRPLLLTAFTRATRHLSVVTAAGRALPHAVAHIPARPRRTRLAELARVAQSTGASGSGGSSASYSSTTSTGSTSSYPS